ncbi:MAG TPA: SigE family RNA polymerase sigma factor [Mycobacteriales bacterium]|nr:SigE family RNA polymerase sigma factor [Mycobacteriales bacterium]
MADEPGPAFDAFVRARYSSLCRVAFVMCGDWQQAEDLVQTALAKTYVAACRGGVDSLDAYVQRVLVTTRATWWRRRWHGETPSADLPEHPTSDAYEDADRRSAVLAALATLPAPQRAVLALRFLQDLSEEETGRVLGCPVGTVKSRTARALRTLRDSGLLADKHETIREEACHHA